MNLFKTFDQAVKSLTNFGIFIGSTRHLVAHCGGDCTQFEASDSSTTGDPTQPEIVRELGTDGPYDSRNRKRVFPSFTRLSFRRIILAQGWGLCGPLENPANRWFTLK